MPAYPLLAIFIAISIHYFDLILKDYREAIYYVLVVALLLIGCFYSFQSLGQIVTKVHFEEREIGQAIKKNNFSNSRVSLYALDWQMLDTVKYYGDTTAVSLDAKKEGGTVLKGPVLIVTHTLAENYFYENIGKPRPGFEELKVLYQGEYLVLFYSESNIKLPIFF
jgi:hypothetical protein